MPSELANCSRAEDRDSVLESIIVNGDLSKLTVPDRIRWYKLRCEAVGLDPKTQPFALLTLNGKLVLYATKACTDQLTGIHKLSVSVTPPAVNTEAGIVTVNCRVTFPDGRHVEDMGAVSIAGLRGEALCNALLKATTKAKRRAILSACGLGMLDETEVESIPEARPFPGPPSVACPLTPPESIPCAEAPPRGHDAPQTGKELYGAVKDNKALRDHLNAWGKRQGLPWKMVEWNPAAVSAAWEVVRDFMGEPADDAPDNDPDFDETAGDAREPEEA